MDLESKALWFEKYSLFLEIYFNILLNASIR